MSVIETRPWEPTDSGKEGDAVITEGDALTVRMKGADGEYTATLKPAEKDGIPYITETQHNGASTDRYHLDSQVVAFLALDGQKRVWMEVPERNVVTPRLTGDQVKIAIVGAKRQRESE